MPYPNKAIIKCCKGNHCNFGVCEHFDIVCLRFGKFLLVESFSSALLQVIANYWEGALWICGVGKLQVYRICSCRLVRREVSPLTNPPWRSEGPYLTKRFHPSASIGRACQSDAATSDKDKQILFMLIPRTWFKVEEFRLEQSPYLSYLFVTWRLRAWPSYILH